MTSDTAQIKLKVAEYILSAAPLRKKNVKDKFGDVGIAVFQNMRERRAIYAAFGLWGKHHDIIKCIIIEYKTQYEETKRAEENNSRQNIVNSLAVEQAKRSADAAEESVKVAKRNNILSFLSSFFQFNWLKFFLKI